MFLNRICYEYTVSMTEKDLMGMSNYGSDQFHTVRGYQMLNQQGGQITPAMEDYLEMIYRLCAKENYTRVGRLSDLLHVKPSSASKMIFKLAELGYVKYDRYEIIFLTDKGKKLGQFLLYRHNTVEEFLKLIGVVDTLEETELVEHNLNTETLTKLHSLLLFFQDNPAVQDNYEQFLKKISDSAMSSDTVYNSE